MEPENAKENRKKNILNVNYSKVIVFLIPLFILIYGCGDYFSWWDTISGRSAALNGIERITSSQGFPVVYVYRTEKEFPALKKIIDKNVKNPEVIQLTKAGIQPSGITRVAIGELEADLPESWPELVFIPGITPVVYMYGTNKDGGGEKVRVAWVGTVADLNQWIDKEHNQERFIVLIVFVGGLSLFSALFPRPRRVGETRFKPPKLLLKPWF